MYFILYILNLKVVYQIVAAEWDLNIYILPASHSWAWASDFGLIEIGVFLGPTEEMIISSLLSIDLYKKWNLFMYLLSCTHTKHRKLVSVLIRTKLYH